MARDQIDMTPLQSRDELVAWLEAGVKPISEFRIGTEHEKTPFTLSGHHPVAYEGARGAGARDRSPARHRLSRARHDTIMVARPDPDDAQGPLQDHDRLHAEG